MRRVAVLVNRNAQRASPEVLSLIRACVPAGDVFVSGSLGEAREAAAAIVAGGYDALAIGGGDGTFMAAARDLIAIAPDRLPVFAPLRLGTGNAISDVAGASPLGRDGIRADLAHLATDAPASQLPLLEVDGRLTHFTGAGLDANYAADFRWLVKERLGKGPLAPLVRGVPGLFITAATMTVPRLFARPRMRVRAVNTGAPAHLLGPDGLPSGPPIPEGAVLREGPVTIAAAATITEYARGMTFFPFADGLRGAFQLRLVNVTAGEVLFHLPSAFAGTYRDPDKLWDYAVTGVRLELDEPAVYHVGGDVEPAAASFSVALSRHTVPLLRRRRGRP